LQTVALGEIGERNKKYFEQEIDKLDRWAEDLKEGLERDIKELNAEIAQVGKQAKLAPDLQGKLALQTQKKVLEATRKRKQRELFEAQDEIESRKEKLLTEVEARLKQQVEKTELFTIAWEVR
jgi:exonuclease VII large subunit